MGFFGSQRSLTGKTPENRGDPRYRDERGYEVLEGGTRDVREDES